MSTLLLRLSGPQQSWGTQSRFTNRDTEREPTKSGVLGLLCAALGKPRSEQTNWQGLQLAQLTSLRFGVRVDRAGRLSTDYHTVGGGAFPNLERYGLRNFGVWKASGAKASTVVSNRLYLANADFLVGLEGEAGLLEILLKALMRPIYPVFLGRKAFVPALPVYLPASNVWGKPIHPGGLLEALSDTPFLGSAKSDRRQLLQVHLDSLAAEGELRYDVPLDYARREFTYRWVTRSVVPMPEVAICSWLV
jgi:CRISPR system Cascade subunit CasD